MYLKCVAVPLAILVAGMCICYSAFEVIDHFEIGQFEYLKEERFEAEDGDVYYVRNGGPLGIFDFLAETRVPTYIIHWMMASLRHNLMENFVGMAFGRFFQGLGGARKVEGERCTACIGDFITFDCFTRKVRYVHSDDGMIPVSEIVDILEEGYREFWNSSRYLNKGCKEVDKPLPRRHVDGFDPKPMIREFRKFTSTKIFWLYVYLYTFERHREFVIRLYRDIFDEMFLRLGESDILDRCFVLDEEIDEPLEEPFILERHPMDKLLNFPLKYLFAPEFLSAKLVDWMPIMTLLRSKSLVFSWTEEGRKNEEDEEDEDY